MKDRRSGFSLVEVVLALGVISFAIVAIIGVIPTGLETNRATQSNTRAVQIAQDIFASLAGQAQTRYPNATIKQSGATTASDFSFDVTLDGTTPSYTLAADNDGYLVVPDPTVTYPYQITLTITPSPTGFDSGFATQISIRIASRPFNQNYRDFVRIISKF